jgi:2,3-bisphosphoglycerate-independent phosphoglycerate mutase
MPLEAGEPTELEAAKTPNMDILAKEGCSGLHVPVGPGITPGSGPGHLGVFGYDPLSFNIGRGVLSAAGIDFELRPGDVAARGNFCTVDKEGVVQDRRAGRIETSVNEGLCDRLRQIDIDGVTLFLQTVKEHRFLLVLRGEGLSDGIRDTDPQEIGKKPLSPEGTLPKAEKTVEIVKRFIEKAREILREESPANMILLRGFASKPDWPQFTEVFGLRTAAAAGYPMYRGLARLLGMTILPHTDNLDQRIQLIQDRFSDFDFLFVHFKKTDSTGEDRDYDAKVRRIEEADQAVGGLKSLDPEVLIVTGDHSTPSRLGAHSWHPVPVVLWSKTCRPDGVTEFGEQSCIQGSLGPRFPATDIMPLALAHAGRLKKFGA